MALAQIAISTFKLYDDSDGVSSSQVYEVKRSATKIRAVLTIENIGGLSTNYASIILKNTYGTVLGMKNVSMYFSGYLDVTFDYFPASSICDFAGDGTIGTLEASVSGSFVGSPVSILKYVAIREFEPNLEIRDITINSPNGQYVGVTSTIVFTVFNSGSADFIPDPSKNINAFISYKKDGVKTACNQFGIPISQRINKNAGLQVYYDWAPTSAGTIYICVDLVEE